MTVEVDKVEAVLRQYWNISGTSSAPTLHHLAFRIQVMVGQKYSHDNLKYQLCLMQTKALKQELDDPACAQIASVLLGNSHT